MGVGRLSLVCLCVAGLAGAGCTKSNTVREEPARLQVIVVPPDASVQVDGHYFGRARVLEAEPKALSPGIHLMTITADDHFPHDLELELPPGTTTVRVELRPIPP